MSMKTIKTLFSWNTGYSADSVEWCPIENYRNIFVCGTYQLTKNENVDTTERLGKIFLFAFGRNEKELCPVQILETAAVLDQKWCQYLVGGKPALGVVNASGILEIYSLVVENHVPSLILMAKAAIDESDNLALSLDWSNNKFDSQPSLIVSDSKGKMTIFQLNESQNLQVSQSWKAHDYEAWICAFDSWNPSTVFTGGDDSKMKIFDSRNTQKPQCVINHDAGVTSFHSNTEKEYILASGSYDQIVRVWDIRQTKDSLAKIDSGGGVWRLKWEPNRRETLLAACMYGGFTVLNWNNDSLDVLAKYEHDSIAYGADWCYDATLAGFDDEHTSNLIATCSFYNCVLTVASFI